MKHRSQFSCTGRLNVSWSYMKYEYYTVDHKKSLRQGGVSDRCDMRVSFANYMYKCTRNRRSRYENFNSSDSGSGHHPCHHAMSP